MVAVLAEPVSCRYCGADDRADDRCSRCGSSWTTVMTSSAASPSTRGLVRAEPGRRAIAVLVDAAVVLVPAAFGGWLLAAGSGVGGLLLVLSGLLVLTEVALVLWLGRTPGHWVTRLRSVDDLDGTPLGLRAIRDRALPHPLSVDLRLGRDPRRPALPEEILAEPTSRQPVRRSGPAASHRSVATAATEVTAGATRTAGDTTSPATSPATGSPATAPDRHSECPVGSPRGPVVNGRPTVGLVLDGGERYEIEHVMLVGRNPVDTDPGPGRRLLALPDLSRRVAKTHLLVEWSGTVLWVTDLGSTSGTAVAQPDGSRVPLAPRVRFAVGIGSVILCGGRSLRVVPGV